MTTTTVLDRLTHRFGTEALAVARTLQRAGFDAVIVGGPVRDALLGGTPHDVDLATSATPDQVRRVFPRTFVVGTGERHGTIGVLAPDGTAFEVTTFRHDVATDGRHATVAFTTDVLEDLVRRDFTINAIAVRPDRVADHGEILDPFDGRADLAHGQLRAVGDAATRFREDYLRILRGYRFSARYGFDLEPATRAAMREAMPGLTHISRERIRDEFLKLAAQAQDAGRFAATLDAMREDGLLAVVLPELQATVGVTQGIGAPDVFTHSIMAADHHGAAHPLRRLAALLHDVGKPATRVTHPAGRVEFVGAAAVGAERIAEIARRWAFPNSDAAYLTECVRKHGELVAAGDALTPATLRSIARHLGDGVSLVDLVQLRQADHAAQGPASVRLGAERLATIAATTDALLHDGMAIRVRDLAVTGRDLMDALELRPGPAVGAYLEALLTRVVEDPSLNTRATLLAHAAALAAVGGPPASIPAASRRTART